MNAFMTKLAVTASLLAASLLPANAQVFTTPNASEFTFGDPSVGYTTSTSCYAVSSNHINTAYGPADLYVAARSAPLTGGRSEFVWQLTKPGDPLTVLDAASAVYTNITDVEVGVVKDANGMINILVSYYRLGTGHFVDIYEVTTLPFSPVLYNTSIQLSNSTQYGRIRMDCHRLREVAIVWKVPGNDIRTIACLDGVWGNPVDIGGTAAELMPDVALCKTASGIRAHYVYYSFNNYSSTITKSSLDFTDILPSPATLYPNIEDTHYDWLSQDERIVLDCPDDYDADNWAYVYSNGYSDIKVRYMDYHSTGVADTVSVIDGSLGNASVFANNKNWAPSLYYGEAGVAGTTGNLSVGWFNNRPNGYNTFIAVEMKEDGSAIANTPDYMELPNAVTTFAPGNPYSPGIAFSRASDASIVPTDFQYATYTTFDPSNGYQLHHAFHKWGDVVFKPGGTSIQEQQTANACILTNIYPNPFTSQISVSLAPEKEGLVQLSLTDMAGRVVWQQQKKVSRGSQQLSGENLDGIAPGTYILTVTFAQKRLGSKMVTKQ